MNGLEIKPKSEYISIEDSLPETWEELEDFSAEIFRLFIGIFKASTRLVEVIIMIQMYKYDEFDLY